MICKAWVLLAKPTSTIYKNINILILVHEIKGLTINISTVYMNTRKLKFSKLHISYGEGLKG